MPAFGLPCPASAYIDNPMEVFRAEVLADLPKASDLFSLEDNLYLVSKPWWDYWMSLSPSDTPAPIDNLSLFERYDAQEGWKTSVLRGDLAEDKDFLYVPVSIWRRLVSKLAGGPEVMLNVIAGMPDWSRITLAILHATQTRYLSVSSHMQMTKFKQLLSKEFQLPETRFVVALKSGDSDYSVYSTLEEMGLKHMDQVCLRERRTSFLDVTRPDDEDEDLAAAIKLSLQGGNEPQDAEPPRLLPDKSTVQARVTASLAETKQGLSIKKLQHSARWLDKLQRDWEGCI